jgi:hypothetical protein
MRIFSPVSAVTNPTIGAWVLAYVLATEFKIEEPQLKLGIVIQAPVALDRIGFFLKGTLLFKTIFALFQQTFRWRFAEGFPVGDCKLTHVPESIQHRHFSDRDRLSI